MITSGSRTTSAVILLITLLGSPVGIAAQQAQQSAPQQTPPATPAGTGQKVAAAEEQTKPSRGFFSTLFHNLGDDVRHIPRKNTLYWLGAGAAGALIVHPADDNINNRLSDSDSAKTFFKAGKYRGSFPVPVGIGRSNHPGGRHPPSQRA